MAYATIHLGLVSADHHASHAAADYAIALSEAEEAHLSVSIAAPLVEIPAGRILPLIRAAMDEADAERLAKAKAECHRIEAAARLAGVAVDCRVLQGEIAAARGAFVKAARISDIVILPRPAAMLTAEQGIIEAALFGAGRPVIVVPAEWPRGPVFERITVAWDGGQRAARAVGDAMPLLARATEVEIVCIGADARKSAAGADLAGHLARRCRGLKLTELQIEFGDAGITLRDHLATVTPDLLVMGAYAHPRLLQLVLGGVTSTMLGDARLPVLYSH